MVARINTVAFSGIEARSIKLILLLVFFGIAFVFFPARANAFSCPFKDTRSPIEKYPIIFEGSVTGTRFDISFNKGLLIEKQVFFKVNKNYKGASEKIIKIAHETFEEGFWREIFEARYKKGHSYIIFAEYGKNKDVLRTHFCSTIYDVERLQKHTNPHEAELISELEISRAGIDGLDQLILTYPDVEMYSQKRREMLEKNSDLEKAVKESNITPERE